MPWALHGLAAAERSLGHASESGAARRPTATTDWLGLRCQQCSSGTLSVRRALILRAAAACPCGLCVCCCAVCAQRLPVPATSRHGKYALIGGSIVARQAQTTSPRPLSRAQQLSSPNSLIVGGYRERADADLLDAFTVLLPSQEPPSLARSSSTAAAAAGSSSTRLAGGGVGAAWGAGMWLPLLCVGVGTAVCAVRCALVRRQPAAPTKQGGSMWRRDKIDYHL